MNFGLLLPAGLLALFALAVPLLLHLTRRTEQRPTLFAALRWLHASQRPRRQVRFDELLLLALRLLLLAALALLLAQPVLHGLHASRPWVVVAPSIERAAALAAYDAPDADWRWLAPGFPKFTEESTGGAQAPDGVRVPDGAQATSSLLRELDATLAADASVTVLVPRQLGGLDGERPALRRTVEWRIVAAKAAVAEADARTPAVLAVRYGPAEDRALRYLRAAAAAWQATATDSRRRSVQVTLAPAAAALEPGTEWLIWLAPGALPTEIRDWIAAGGTALLGASTRSADAAEGISLWRDAEGNVIVRGRALDNGRIMQLTRELAPTTLPELLDPDFPDRLRALFDPPATPNVAFAESHAPRSGGPALPPAPEPLQPWLAVLVAALFLAERWLATSTTRGRVK